MAHTDQVKVTLDLSKAPTGFPVETWLPWLARTAELVMDRNPQYGGWRDIINWIAGSIRDQLPVPPMPEPPVHTVVEASCVHSESRMVWHRHADGNWYTIGGVPDNPDDWASLVEPKVLAKAVTGDE